jgi:4-hydroxy-2-oxoheptanedioate aldolase
MSLSNPFKQAIAEGRPQVGLWTSLCSNIVCNILVDSGFDWIVIDTEHAPNEIGSVLGQLQALGGGTATPVVRPAWNDMVLFKRLLDIGAHSLLVPFVQSADEAREAVRRTRYPPEGVRGVAVATRANRYGREADYFATVHDHVCVIVQLETREALGRLEEIAAVEGVDGIFIGPSDLSASLGHLGNPGADDTRAAIADALARAKTVGTPAGILTASVEDAHRYFEAGFTFVAVGADVGVLRNGADALAREFARYRR